MPIKSDIERAKYNREYHQRPDVKDRSNASAKLRYENGGKAQKKAYDTERRKDPAFVAHRREYLAERRKTRWAKVKIKELQCSARRRGLAFCLEETDLMLPEKCPVLGIKLRVGKGVQGPASPSVDRIDTTKGYVRGNVVVVSSRANSLKGSATLDEMKKIADFYLTTPTIKETK